MKSDAKNDEIPEDWLTFAEDEPDPAWNADEDGRAEELCFAEEFCFAEEEGGGDAPLFEAIRALDAEKVKELLEAGTDPNVRDAQGWSALQVAAAEGSLALVRLLLERGARPDARQLLLFFAADSGRVELVRFLMERLGVSVNVRDPDGNSLLHHAADSRNPELVRELILAGADVRAQGSARLTALERAAWNGDLESVRLLVEAGADVNAEGGRWSAPLTESRNAFFESIFFYGPPIYAAASRGHLEVVRYLVGQGADVNARDCEGRTVLHAASRAENPDCMQFLLGLGAE